MLLLLEKILLFNAILIILITFLIKLFKFKRFYLVIYMVEIKNI